ncbi:hypothetical protein TM239_50660 [Bradyrhizobium sp. TM239]|nr:hypothetical protein TM239_50660 [Bradyrhizobium sp. TM239]
MDSGTGAAGTIFCENNPMHSREVIEIIAFSFSSNPAVIPGRASWREPGIHRAAVTVARWIPGPRLPARPE